MAKLAKFALAAALWRVDTEREQLTNEHSFRIRKNRGAAKNFIAPAICLKRLPDGDLDYLGRMDFQVKIRGFHIELGEIEAAMVKHPAISQSLVIAQQKHPPGGEQRLVGYFVAKAAMNISEIRTFLGNHCRIT
ncbi:MAG: hypothetical protein R3C26_19835 [Calditrichia bacterium]